MTLRLFFIAVLVAVLPSHALSQVMVDDVSGLNEMTVEEIVPLKARKVP